MHQQELTEIEISKTAQNRSKNPHAMRFKVNQSNRSCKSLSDNQEVTFTGPSDFIRQLSVWTITMGGGRGHIRLGVRACGW